MSNTLDHRPLVHNDLPFVIDSWVQSYRCANAAGLIQMSDWKAVMRPQVVKVLGRSGVEVTVAYKPGEEAGMDIYGWICTEAGVRVPVRVRDKGKWVSTTVVSETPLVHYIFVKQAYRRLGVARGLFAAAGVDPSKPFMYTCRTGVVSKFDRMTPRHQGTWMPLLARYPKEGPEDEHDQSV